MNRLLHRLCCALGLHAWDHPEHRLRVCRHCLCSEWRCNDHDTGRDQWVRLNP